MTGDALLTSRIDARGVATLTMSRQSVANAFDDSLIAVLTDELELAAEDSAIRAVVLTGAGEHFSAGADLAWMKQMASASEADNLEDARALSRLMQTLAELPKPTVARVQGAAIGGGAGLVACCDIAVCSTKAVFALAEVGIGLIPAVVSPYVVAAIGARQARRYFLTGERIKADDALRLGLVHAVAEPEALDDAVGEFVGRLLAGGPVAQRQAKRLIDRVSGVQPDDELRAELVRQIARLRTEPEAQEGMAAFLAKRKPAWRDGD